MLPIIYILFGTSVEQKTGVTKVLLGYTKLFRVNIPFTLGIYMIELSVFLTMCLAGFSLLLLVASLTSFVRVRHPKLLFVSIAFTLFFVKALLLVTKTLDAPIELTIIDFGILAMLYLAVAKK